MTLLPFIERCKLHCSPYSSAIFCTSLAILSDYKDFASPLSPKGSVARFTVSDIIIINCPCVKNGRIINFLQKFKHETTEPSFCETKRRFESLAISEFFHEKMGPERISAKPTAGSAVLTSRVME